MTAVVRPPLEPHYPLRTYQFRVGILPPPDDAPGPGTEGRGFRATAPAAPPPAPEPAPYVAGVKKVSGLTVTVEKSETKEGGNALHRYLNPDRATWEPITLEQGLAVDGTLESWAQAVLRFLREGRVDPANPVKRNVVIDVWDDRVHGRTDPTGNLTAGSADGSGLPLPVRIRRYVVLNAWISKFHAVPTLDALAGEVGLISVELTHEGWRPEQPAGTGGPASALPGPQGTAIP